MEDNFRNALIILSGFIIAAIFIHGLWTIRKQKNPYKLKTSKEKVEPVSRNFDDSGFDQYGVGQVKVLKQANEPKVESEKDFEQTISLEEINHLDNGQHQELYNDFAVNEKVSEHDVELKKQKNSQAQVEIEAKKEISLEQPMYQQPVTNAKPARGNTSQVASKKFTPTKPVESLSKEEIKRNQMEINFGEGVSIDDENVPNTNVADNAQEKTGPNEAEVNNNIDTQVIILSVVMPDNHQMSGAALLPSLLTLGMKYGEMNIFHRHQDSAGNGPVTFSLANMLNPGSFDLDTMETFVTQGVSLFMTLPNAGDPFAAFDQMLLAAKQLANEFNAQLLDDKRNIMTKQTEQHYVSKIREFDRQHRLARF
ncbi:cell division protein ZipA [Colwellia sp. 4_MG-2023]|jgi:cell division protein ZipA|uniref:cell division protein ZipA n=1 Tax=unclassified Colwellia TaxID=196834 RepID=UPI0026E32721|nr:MULTISPECIES: cell division protein ZipA [unclassified Colwellia]MDO6489036.1 cell division protein ZipA [Colwellia sp. 6_MG-2023]MDO6508369.1 cell division protein ZipA [Colwellia sp. 5_MG-2023]MDO6556985.1 cell division protein ZipA [Colwellia sp. 4_MG-2023]